MSQRQPFQVSGAKPPPPTAPVASPSEGSATEKTGAAPINFSFSKPFPFSSDSSGTGERFSPSALNISGFKKSKQKLTRSNPAPTPPAVQSKSSADSLSLSDSRSNTHSSHFSNDESSENGIPTPAKESNATSNFSRKPLSFSLPSPVTPSISTGKSNTNDPIEPNIPALDLRTSQTARGGQKHPPLTQNRFASDTQHERGSPNQFSPFPISPDNSFSHDDEHQLEQSLAVPSRGGNHATTRLSSKPVMTKSISSQYRGGREVYEDHHALNDERDFSRDSSEGLGADDDSARGGKRERDEDGEDDPEIIEAVHPKRTRVEYDHDRYAADDSDMHDAHQHYQHAPPAPTHHRPANDFEAFLDSQSDTAAKLREKWTTCSMEEWVQGGKEFEQQFGELIKFVNDHMTTRIQQYTGIHTRIKEHGEVLDSRDERLKRARGDLVRQTDALVGGGAKRG